MSPVKKLTDMFIYVYTYVIRLYKFYIDAEINKSH